MTQTPKILSALLAELPDNTTGDISAENIRDAVVSLFPARGQIYHTNNGTSTFTGTGVYSPIVVTTALDNDTSSSDVSQPASATLKMLKNVAQVALVNATLEVLPANNNQRYTFTFSKNGTPIPELAFTAYFGNLGGNAAGVFLSGLMAMTYNDELSVVVKNDTSTASLTCSQFTMSLIGFIK